MRARRGLWLILLLALALRLAFGLAQDTTVNPGADSGWYLGNAYTLVTGKQPPGMVNEVSNLASPPLYFILIGIPQAFLSTSASIVVVRVIQALLSTATCYFAYRLALRLTRRESAGLIAAFALAVSPAFIVETAQILTETTYIFLLTGGMWLYLESIEAGQKNKKSFTTETTETAEGNSISVYSLRPLRSLWFNYSSPMGALLLAAALFGLATLTRAVLLVFPLALAAYLLLMRQGWRRAALFLLVYALVVSSWTVYSVARWNRFVIAGTGFDAMIYIGATEWQSPQAVDQALEQQSPDGSYAQGAQAVIGSDPLGWVRRRVGQLAEAYLQPHGTTFFPGESLRDLALTWLREDRSVAGLVALAHGDAFWPKLALYIMHYTAMIGGVIGMILERRRWRVALPMIGFIAYLTLVHLALYALPRYLFPNEIFLWVFAAAALNRLIRRPALEEAAYLADD